MKEADCFQNLRLASKNKQDFENSFTEKWKGSHGKVTKRTYF